LGEKNNVLGIENYPFVAKNAALNNYYIITGLPCSDVKKHTWA
jgi:hypothetical protein